MKNFEEFKASREKMDPSTRKMNKHQWEQAYDAYRRSRERVRRKPDQPARRSHGGDTSSSKLVASRGMHVPSALSKSAQLRAQVRAESAYAELRTMVNMLAWCAVAVVVVLLLLKLAFYTSVQSGVIVIGSALMQILLVFIVKLLAQVLIDIPDIALFHASQVSDVDVREEDGA